MFRSVLTLAVALLAAGVACAADTSETPTHAAVERGRYLATAVLDCVACHVRRDAADQSKTTGPDWAGGTVFDERWGLPGRVVAPNLTSDVASGLGAWTDDEILRAIREGRNRRGEPLFPLMPVELYRRMSEDDARALVAFLRTIPPVATPDDAPVTELPMPRSALPALPPLEAPVPAPADDPVSRGAYLASLTGCIGCHTPTSGGRLLEDRLLAGGVRFTTPFGGFVTPNVTPDAETGIGAWSSEEIRRVITTGVRRNGVPVVASFMPWYIYQNMTPGDVDDLVAYLRSIPPVRLDVNDPANHHPLGG